MNRKQLEKLALETISSSNYYELANSVDLCTDQELKSLIACNGDYDKENEFSESVANQ